MIDANEQEYFDHLSKVEVFAHKLLNSTSEKIDLWEFQLDLVRYIYSIQKKIQKLKQSKNETKGQIKIVGNDQSRTWLDEIRRLQTDLSKIDKSIETFKYIFNLIKQVGDSFAWLVLNLNEQQIIPLTQNDKPNDLPHGIGLNGLINVAYALYEAGLGFPLIHDITNCLRIGDITFINKETHPITLEVKSKQSNENSNNINITIINKMIDKPENREVIEKIKDVFGITSFSDDLNSPGNIRDNRTGRQLDRMADANELQLAKHGEINKIQKKDVVTFQVNPPSQNNFSVIQALAEEAKLNTFATKIVDKAISYIAFYSSPTRIMPWGGGIDTLMDLAQEKLEAFTPILSIISNKNEKTFWSSTTRQTPPSVKPVLLWDLSENTIFDIISNRLVIIICIDFNEITEELKNFDIVVEIETDSRGKLFRVRKEVLISDESITIELSQPLSTVIAWFAYGCFPLSEITKTITEMINTWTEKLQLKNYEATDTNI